MRVRLSHLSKVVCLIALTVASTALTTRRASAEDFDWRNYNGQNWLETTIENQNPWGGCYAFALTAAEESNYYMTRNDCTYKPNLATMCIAEEERINGRPGPEFLITNGCVLEQELPFNPSQWSPSYPLSTGWQNRVFKTTAVSSLNFPTVADVKNTLKLYGPITVSFGANVEYLDPPNSYGMDAHTNALVGFHDDPNVAGGGYWIVKNSWGADWNCTGMAPGYGKISYSHGAAFTYADMYMSGASYYTGSLATACWTAGAGTWSKGSSTKWTNYYDSSAYAWENKETNAVFNNTTGSAIAISGSVIAHSMSIFTSGYSFSGGSLTITAGGLATLESLTISSPVYIGGPQNWWVNPGKTVTVSGPLHTIISDVTFTGPGTTVISNAIDGGGMINGMGRKPGGLIVSGAGALQLTYGSLSFAGDITVNTGSGGLTIASPTGNATLSGAWFGGGNTSITSTTGTVAIGGGNSNYSGNISKATGGYLRFIPADGMYGTFSGVISGTTTVQQNGPGTTVFAGANTYSGTTQIFTGGTMTNSVLQADIGVGIPSTSFLDLQGGVLQSNSEITFTRSLGTSGSRFRMTSAGGGFSAGAGQMTVNIGGGTSLTWGTTVGTQLVGTLKLSSTTATAGTIFANPINLNGAQRTIQVDDNPTAIYDYAMMAGVLSGAGSSALKKTGNGILVLRAANTYAGATTLSGGLVQADIGIGIPTNSLISFDGGQLQPGSAMASFTRSIGTGAGMCQFTANGGGFSACVDEYVVNIGGGANLTWGTIVGTNLVGPLKLGGPNSAYTTTFQNGINLNAGSRTVQVVDNPNSPLDCSVMSGVLSGAGSLTKTGDGILLFTGSSANTYTGPTTVASGTLRLAKDNGVVAIPGDLIISGSTMHTTVELLTSGQIAPTSKLSFTGPVSTYLLMNGYDLTVAGLSNADTIGVIATTPDTGPCTLTVNNTTDCSFNGNLADPGNGVDKLSVTKSGSGKLTLDGFAIMYSGATTINAGTLVFKDIYPLGGDGTILSNPITNYGTFVLEATITRDWAFAGAISGSGRLDKTGPRTVVLTGSSNYSGPTVILGGALQADIGVGIPLNSTLALDGGVLQSNSEITVSRTIGTGVAGIYFGAAGGGFASGAGNMTVNLNGGAALTWGSTIGTHIVGPLMLSSITSAATTIFQNPVNLNGAVRTIQVLDNPAISSADCGVMTGVLSGTGSSGILKTGDGCLIFTANNTYSGSTTIRGGALTADNGAGLPTASLLVLDGGVLRSASAANFSRTIGTGTGQVQFTSNGGGFAAGGSAFAVSLNGGAALTWGTASTNVVGTLRLNSPFSLEATTFQNNINLGSSNRTIQVDDCTASPNDMAIMSGVLSGTGGLIKTGIGELRLTNANTYTGTTTISGGALIIGNGGTTGSLASSTIVNNAALLFIRSNSYTYSGNISGTGTVYNSSGTTTLSSTSNSYTGGTVVAGGKLIASSLGAPGGNVTVYPSAQLQVNGILGLSAYATLTNSGTVTGGVTIADNAKATGPGKFDTINILEKGVFQPGTGNGIATAYCTGNVTWNPGGKYRVDINDLTSAGSDLWAITGNLSVTNTYSAAPFMIEPLSIDTSTNYPGWLAGFDNSQYYSWQIATIAGVISGLNTSTVQVDLGVFQNTLAGSMYLETRDSGHSLYLCYSPTAGLAGPAEVPEPGTLVMLTLGILGFLAHAWRKRK